MQRVLLAAVLVLVVLALHGLAPVSRAHGGVFRGPVVKPGTGPNKPAPVKGPAGAGAGPVTAGPAGFDSPSPVTGGKGAPSAARPTTGGLALQSQDLASWSVWWGFNRDGFLRVKEHVGRSGAETGGDDFFLGLGESRRRGTREPASERVVREVIVPALVGALGRSKDDDVATGCMVALARCTPPELAPEVAPLLARHVAERDHEVAETAVLSLGILGHEPSVPLLRDLLLDREAARERIGKVEVDPRRRAFAAFGLGLVGARSEREDVRRFVASALCEALRAGDGATDDLEVACVLALGLVPTGDGAGLELLLELLDDDDRSRGVRAHVPRALAGRARALAEDDPVRRRAVGALVAAVGRHSRAPREVVAGAALALGALGDCDPEGLDAEIRAALVDLVDHAPDAETRGFARIALGEVGGRRGSDDPAQGRAEVVKPLAAALARGSGAGRRWSALALGVMGRGLVAGREPVPRELADAVRAELEEAKAATDLSALAISTGLLGDADGAPIVRAKLGRYGQDEFRGHGVVALGLLRDREALDTVRDIATESRYRPALLAEAAAALALLGDAEAVPLLVEMLSEAHSLSSQAAISSALGTIGDARAVDALVHLLEDRTSTPGARAFAAVALGIVGDAEPLPWTFRYSAGINYLSAPPTLYDDFAGKGILNLL